MPGAGRRGRGGWWLMGTDFFLERLKKVLEIVVMTAQFHEYTKTHWIVYFQSVHFIVCELYLNYKQTNILWKLTCFHKTTLISIFHFRWWHPVTSGTQVPAFTPAVFTGCPLCVLALTAIALTDHSAHPRCSLMYFTWINSFNPHNDPLEQMKNSGQRETM